MDFQTITHELRDGIAILTLNRPEVMNALNARMRAEITHILTEGLGDARVVVLTGAGRGFCSGQDLSDGSALQKGLERVLAEEYEPMLRAIVDCPVPVIAAVNGVAAGAGANLALACDVVIAAESASFVQAFTRIGLIPDAGGTWFLPRLVGLARAMGAALFAEKITARQAASWGMIWECVADEAFERTWRGRAAHLAQGPSRAYRRLRQAMRAAAANDLEEQLALEARLQGECGGDADFREGIQAFLEKRAPVFKGC